MGFLTDKNAAVRRALADSPPDRGDLEESARSARSPRDFAAALRTPRVGVIAEIKRSSPSAGGIAEADTARRAGAYEAAGAVAVSVLTDGPHFGGSLDDLEAASRATSRVPVLRKDFLLEPVQLLEARAAGADAVLLIAASLRAAVLAEMLDAASALGLGVLLETHSREDLDAALATGATVIGINARDLETLEVDVAGAMAMLRNVPPDRLAVLESGIAEPEQVAAAHEAGACAVLVGEALMRAPDPAVKIRELMGESE